MIGFGVVASIRQDTRQTQTRKKVGQHGTKLRHIRLRSPPNMKCQNEMIDRLHQVGTILQVSDDATIIDPQEVLQHQTREQLRLRKDLRATSVEMVRQRPPADRQGRYQNRSRRLAGACHTSYTDASTPIV